MRQEKDLKKESNEGQWSEAKIFHQPFLPKTMVTNASRHWSVIRRHEVTKRGPRPWPLGLGLLLLLAYPGDNNKGQPRCQKAVRRPSLQLQQVTLHFSIHWSIDFGLWRITTVKPISPLFKMHSLPLCLRLQSFQSRWQFRKYFDMVENWSPNLPKVEYCCVKHLDM